MRFAEPLQPGVLLRRYQRFLADVELPDGRQVTAHTANTGAMHGCATPGSRVWLSDSGNPKRRCRYTWELVETTGDTLVGINTGVVNRLVLEGIHTGVVTALQGYLKQAQEVRYGQEGSRIDLLLEGNGPPCYVEIKNVTALEGQGTAFFPDAASIRARKHLRELMGVVQEGGRAVLLFCVQRGDAEAVRPADGIDPAYGQLLRTAVSAGVEVLAYRAQVTPAEITLVQSLPVIYS